jgi:hypothetical protein
VTEVEIEVESTGDAGTVNAADLADALATAQLEVAHELEQEAAVEEAQETAESAMEIAIDAISSQPASHEHSEYSLGLHSHSELEGRVGSLEQQVSELRASLESTEAEVEEVEPVAQEPTEPQRRRAGFRRGR